MAGDPLSLDDEPAERGLWDVADVSRFLKASRSWVYHRAESGELPCLRIGGLLRFEPDAIRSYARGDRGQSTTLRLARPALRGR